MRSGPGDGTTFFPVHGTWLPPADFLTFPSLARPMQRTLFFIPHSLFGIPLFGFGWLLGLLVISFVVWLGLLWWSGRSIRDELRQNGALWGIAAAVIAFVLPAVEIDSYGGEPVGVAVRGYGLLLLIGVASAVGLALIRARRAGIAADDIFGLALWLFIGGIGGARLFYIIEYRDNFIGGGLGPTLRQMLDFTRGGLVVYGSIIGGSAAMFLYCARRAISPFRMGDVVIPCLFLGLFFGRIGCLMNGCCYGGRCEEGPLALSFPQGSPVYARQLTEGELLGLTIEPARSGKSKGEVAGTITAVEPGSPADRRGIRPGSSVRGIQLAPPPADEIDPTTPIDDSSQLSAVAVVDGQPIVWTADELPARALPVRAAQVISSVTGLILCILLLAVSRWVPLREGMLMAIGFIAYAVVRFVLEIVRSDEPGQFGTQLTISQWVSLVVVVLSIGLILYIQRRDSGGRVAPVAE